MNGKGIFAITLLIAAMLAMATMPVSAVGPSNQKVEFGNGNTEKVYPFIIAPRPGECGSDNNDLILQYNTYWGSRVDPDKVRWSSSSSIMNFYLSKVFYRSGLSANGLSSTTTRVCIGTKGQIFGPDALERIYLWHK